MFVAFPLYVIHALLTGTSIALTNALEIHDGFGFSAGLFDFLLNWNIATKPGLLIVIGLAYAVIYYFLFRAVIRRWNLRTPGREDEDDDNNAMTMLIDQDMGPRKSEGTGQGTATDASPSSG
jgi:PTS system N-acetylglucosamine-specific IIC component